MTFDLAAAVRTRPSGATRAALVETYGDPAAGAVRTSKGQFTPAAGFAERLVTIDADDLKNFPPYGAEKTERITLHRRVAPVFRATWAELVRLGIEDNFRVYSGATVFRHMLWDYDNPVSLHAYGAAIDFDAPWNGYGIPASKIQMDPEIVEVFERFGFHWGGRWNPTDAMHMQFTDPLPGVPVMPWQDKGPREARVSIIKPDFPQLKVQLRNTGGALVAAPAARYRYGGQLVEQEGHRLRVGDLALAVLGTTEADLTTAGLHVTIQGADVQIERGD